MPTYVYECKECDHRFEIFQSFSAEALRTCPECNQVALRKVLFPAGVVFKGSGFYVNDSRGPRPKASSSGAKAEGNKPEGKEKKGEKKESSESKSPSSANGSNHRDRKPVKSGAE